MVEWPLVLLWLVYFIDQVGYHTISQKKVGNVPSTIWGTASPFDEVYLK